MQTYHFKKAADGSVTISGLPPSEELTILILPSSGQYEWQEKMKQWMNL
jgi:hypothetical protein